MSTQVHPATFAPIHSLDTLYGNGATIKVRQAPILVVGAGGVGCELVKNLACVGFASITLVDLDTIDVSNLNRQFLFRKKHVGKSKATEAAASIRAMLPNTNIHSIMGNIKEARFDISFFKTFALVCNALDNLEARRHVNRMCLAAQVPLIESGSTGYNGQCSVIGKGVECYDCTEKPPQKSYAVCTIRSTPDKPVHCVVWAKFLFELVFGADDDGNVLKDLDGGGNSSESPQETEANISQQKDAVNSPKRKVKAKKVRYSDGESAAAFATRVCERVFVDDIEEQRAMKELWKERQPPLLYDVDNVANEKSIDLEKLNLLEQRVWTKEECAGIFKATLIRIVEKRKSEIGSLSFDKDDTDALSFVASASNLRAYGYGVPLQSPFSIKGIAGNIVHAIATTNAMVSGLIVLEVLKAVVNGGDLKDSLTTFVSKAPTGNRVKKILCPERLQSPNKKCYVCSKGQLHLSIDVEKTPLCTLLNFVLKKKMGILEPSVNLTTGEYHNTLYESGAGLEADEIEIYEANERKMLKELRVENGSQLVVEDFAQNFTATIHVNHVEEGELKEVYENVRFKLDGEAPKAAANGDSAEKAEIEAEDVDDEIIEVEVGSSIGVHDGKSECVEENEKAGSKTNTGEFVGKKRSLEIEEKNCVNAENGPEVKKVRSAVTENGKGDDVKM